MTAHLYRLGLAITHSRSTARGIQTHQPQNTFCSSAPCTRKHGHITGPMEPRFQEISRSSLEPQSFVYSKKQLCPERLAGLADQSFVYSKKQLCPERLAGLADQSFVYSKKQLCPERLAGLADQSFVYRKLWDSKEGLLWVTISSE